MMENPVILFFQFVLETSGWQILMFFISGIAFELGAEFIKATLFPANKVDKEGKKVSCPRWLGMVLGAVITVLYLIMAYAASSIKGFYIPGGAVFIPVWFILFYFYQYKALIIAKWLRDKMFPRLKDPDYVKIRKTKETTEADLDLSSLTDEQIVEIVRQHKAKA